MIARIAGEILFAATRFLVGGHPRWRGCEPSTRQRIYFANHASHLDTLIMVAALPAYLRETTHPVAAHDYWGTGPVQRFVALGVLNAVLVERSGAKDPLAPMREALSKGHSLIIFPEGTRRNEPVPGDFKAGLYHLAKEFPEAELVPVYLTNLARAYPKGAILPAPISSSANFGTPFKIADGEDKAAFLARAQAAVVELADTEAAQ
ncbi:lysophospholipid acyltransferase family protein [Erythrobacter sp. YT30]|uniref:lysophospholipid acyltransferase family protein n=1 Tax=Erythrobacter sp. YT30 TaxID=1735012 RepID=UPI00076DBE06|nr:lysophospholipid acyltransferase family protein [Erythrobacter sp. YT30]KWV91621.1 acyltransferase [Erythrobacter sp. YT30]